MPFPFHGQFDRWGRPRSALGVGSVFLLFGTHLSEFMGATRFGGCSVTTTIHLGSCLAAIPDRRRAEGKRYGQVGYTGADRDDAGTVTAPTQSLWQSHTVGIKIRFNASWTLRDARALACITGSEWCHNARRAKAILSGLNKPPESASQSAPRRHSGKPLPTRKSGPTPHQKIRPSRGLKTDNTIIWKRT